MQIVRVRLRKPRRVFSFACRDINLARNDVCIVQTDRGIECGICVLPPEPCPPDMEKRHTMRLLRKANPRDEDTYHKLVEEERRAGIVCLEKIKQHNLPMKLVDVEYTFDRRKVIFYFTAEDRVDFRELVRDLAHQLRTRIELLHIQVRDEAKMVGGLGSCGRELCCATWLCEFKPISMRMAKRQNLSLNPSKISGQCGRLLCCLGYENDQYAPPKKKAKKQQEEAGAPVKEKESVLAENLDNVKQQAERAEAESALQAGMPVAEAEAERQAEAGAVAATGGQGEAAPPSPEKKAGVKGRRRSGRRRSRRRKAQKAQGKGGGPGKGGTA